MDRFDIGGVTGTDPFAGVGAYAGTPEDKCVSSPRGDVYYWVTRGAAENAPWLVLLHGAGMDHTVFDGAAESLSRNYNIIAVDLPLHGLSEVYGEFTLSACAYDVRDILNEEGVERAVVAGHCIGGCAAQTFARQFCEYCAGLVLIDTFPFGQSDNSGIKALGGLAGVLRAMPARAFASALSGAFCVTMDASRFLMRVMRMQNTACVADAMADTFFELPGTAAGEYACPVLCIVGDTDRVGGIRTLGRRAAEEYGYELAVIPHAGHTPYLDNPTAFLAALEDFLSRII